MNPNVKSLDHDAPTVTFDHDDGSVVVVVGSGPGGGTLANELCQSGVDVVLFDAGPRYDLGDFENDQYHMDTLLSWRDQRRTTGNHPLVRDWPDLPGLQVKAVGGCSIHWVGNCPRIQAHEFKARSTYGEISGTELMDWPIDFEDIEPYYERAEDRMGVAGSKGIPHMRPTNMSKLMGAAAGRVGYTNFHTGRVAINQAPRNGRNACDEIGFCLSGCKSGAKWSTLYTEIPDAETTGHCELRSNSMVLKVQHNSGGKVTGVLYSDPKGVQHFQKARVVSLACNSIESPRLLLNSASNLFPDGLANSSGLVGKYHMIHVNGQIFATYGKPVNFHRGRVGAGTIEDEKRFDPSRGFVGGYYFLAMGGVALPGMHDLMAPNKWGREVSSFIEEYSHMAGIAIIGEDLPMEKNCITLHSDEKDQYGLPIPHVSLNEGLNEVAMKNHFYKQASALLDAVGSNRIVEAPMGPASHNMGTNRMADNPKDGVVNRWGQCHEIDNLFISDGSQFTTSGSANPTLTIVALAIRQAEHIIYKMRRNEI